jgi:hypothetical protein
MTSAQSHWALRSKRPGRAGFSEKVLPCQRHGNQSAKAWPLNNLADYPGTQASKSFHLRLGSCGSFCQTVPKDMSCKGRKPRRPLLHIYLLMLVLAAQFFGLSKTAPPAAISRIPLFDEIAAQQRYSNAIVQADCNRPGDVWQTNSPFTFNHSRGLRVDPIAREILSEIKPKLKNMTVEALVRSLKVLDGTGFTQGDISDALYPEGNTMIIEEIKTRSPAERQVLRKWPVDTSYIDTGSNGESQEIVELLHELTPPDES